MRSSPSPPHCLTADPPGHLSAHTKICPDSSALGPAHSIGYPSLNWLHPALSTKTDSSSYPSVQHPRPPPIQRSSIQRPSLNSAPISQNLPSQGRSARFPSIQRTSPPGTSNLSSPSCANMKSSGHGRAILRRRSCPRRTKGSAARSHPPRNTRHRKQGISSSSRHHPPHPLQSSWGVVLRSHTGIAPHKWDEPGKIRGTRPPAHKMEAPQRESELPKKS